MNISTILNNIEDKDRSTGLMLHFVVSEILMWYGDTAIWSKLADITVGILFNSYEQHLPKANRDYLRQRFSRTAINNLITQFNRGLLERDNDHSLWLQWICYECNVRALKLESEGLTAELEESASWILIEGIYQLYPHYFSAADKAVLLTAVRAELKNPGGQLSLEEREIKKVIIKDVGFDFADFLCQAQSGTLEMLPRTREVLDTLGAESIAEAQKNVKLLWHGLLKHELVTSSEGKVSATEQMVWWLTAMIDAHKIEKEAQEEERIIISDIEHSRVLALRKLEAQEEVLHLREAELAQKEIRIKELNEEVAILRTEALHSETQAMINRQADIIEKLCIALDESEAEHQPQKKNDELIPRHLIPEIPHPDLLIKGQRILVIGGYDTLPKLREKYASAASVEWIEAGEYRRLSGTVPKVDVVIFDTRKNSHSMKALAKGKFGKLRLI